MVGRGKTSPPRILLFIEERLPQEQVAALVKHISSLGRDPGVDLGHFPELDALIEEAMGGILRKIEAAFPAEARLTALLARTRQIPEEPLMNQTTPAALAARPWPDGVVARYPTAGGAHIDIRIEGHPDDPHAVSTCTACGPLETQTFCGYLHFPPEVKVEHVLEVAEQCAQEHVCTDVRSRT
jgi:hypothetical protein